MRNYKKELEDRIANLEAQVNTHEIAEGLNMIYDLVCEAGLENDPRYKEGASKISSGTCNYIELKCQLDAMVWQKQNLIEQVRATKIGKYILSKCETKETF